MLVAYECRNRMTDHALRFAILIPELVLAHWWERLLHSRCAARLRVGRLAHAGPRLMVIASPWRS